MKTLLAFCVALSLIACFGCDEETPAKPQPKVTTREVLDFGAAWCAPCRHNEPVVVRMELAGVKVRRIDVDLEPDLAKQYGITSVPTYVIREQGKEVKRTQDIRQLKSWQKWLLGKKGEKPSPQPNRQPDRNRLPENERPINDQIWRTP